jgi:serine/threonine protein kinase/tetratricopeptide (TPR) repeat protein
VSASHELGRGATIGRYLIIGLIGKGGMGEVYAAYDPELDRKIALKLLRAHLTAGVDPSEGRARLLREAQAIARLSDPNVVVVFDVGTFEDRVFLAMEFVDGSTLGYWMQAQRRSWREVVMTFMAAGRGLACAHRAGVVHRDFKPDNVMIGRDGKVLVMDFGLARSIDLEPAINAPGDGAATAANWGAEIAPETASLRTAAAVSLRGALRAAVSTSAQMVPVPHAAPPVAPPRSSFASVAAGSSAAPSSRLAAETEDGEHATRDLARDATGFRVGSSLSALNSPLTITGAMMGTPAYMAPEQFRGGRIDARTDQFSFCVALYEALHGERPFQGKTVDELTRHVLAGRVRAAPSGSRIPGWLRRIVLRGLRVAPAERHASMETLLIALGRDPARTRRRWAASASVLGLIVALSAGLVRAQRYQRVRCLGADAMLSGIWELPNGPRLSSRKETIRRAFLSTDKPYAADSFALVRDTLDRYVTAWTDMSRESCEATNVRGDQSAEVLDLRTGCLHNRLSEVRALTNVFTHADGEVVVKAAQAIQSIRPIEECADIPALRAVVRPPDDPGVRRSVADVRAILADLKAFIAAGQYKLAQNGMVDVMERARDTSYPPVIAEALLQLCLIQMDAGDPREAERTCQEAAFLAEGSRDDEVTVAAETMLVFAVGYLQRRYIEADHWARHADAVLKRLGPGHDLMAGWLANNLGTIYENQGRLEEALAAHRRALKLKEAVLGGRSFDVAISHSNVAICLLQLGRIDEACAANDLAMRIMAATLGLDHPQAAPALINAADIRTAQGRYLEARTLAQRALAVAERDFGPDSLIPAYALTAIGSSFVEGGQPALAIYSLERALRLRERNDFEAEVLGDTRFALARALWESGLDPARALTLASQAQADYQRGTNRKKEALNIEQWVNARRTHSQTVSLR